MAMSMTNTPITIPTMRATGGGVVGFLVGAGAKTLKIRQVFSFNLL